LVTRRAFAQLFEFGMQLIGALFFACRCLAFLVNPSGQLAQLLFHAIRDVIPVVVGLLFARITGPFAVVLLILDRFGMSRLGRRGWRRLVGFRLGLRVSRLDSDIRLLCTGIDRSGVRGLICHNCLSATGETPRDG
jgi:hypothetical protein